MSLYFETSFNSLNKFGEELCGDKVEISKNDSSTIMVLSDGLGSGVKANILATLTSKIVITMLNDGADIADVIETIASTLPVCKERQITTVCMGHPAFKMPQVIFTIPRYKKLIDYFAKASIDLIIVA